jgi:hypothetical protein
MPPGFLTGSSVAGEVDESGNGVRTAEVGSGMRIFTPWGAVDGGLAGWDCTGFAIRGREPTWAPGGNFCSCHDSSLNLIIFAGRSEFVLSAPSGGDGRFVGLTIVTGG